MRPQHITAENVRTDHQHHRRGPDASMRPQHITAENRGSLRLRRRVPDGFNEAAAYHCGKRAHVQRRASGAARTRFNEAAAYHCGKPDGAGDEVAALRRASMRPQHITAENAHESHSGCRLVGASMRPQHITAENRAISRASSSACDRLQ